MWRGSDTHHHNSFCLFWHTSGHKVSINELTSWTGCVRWGRQCWSAPGQFWKPFIDMFWNVTHIKYITCTHSFKAALIAFLVTSWLNWPRHCMHVVYLALWYEMIRLQRTPAPLCVYWRALRAQHRFRARLTRTWRWSEVRARLKCLPFDVVVKTFCNWINALLVKRKSDRNSSCEWGGQP